MKNKIYYFTPIIGVVCCMVAYMLLNGGFNKDDILTTILQAGISLVLYFGLAFLLSYICLPKSMQNDKSEQFPFAFLKITSENNLIFSLIKLVSVLFSPDYVDTSYVMIKLNEQGKRKFSRRKMYANILASFLLVLIAYAFSLLQVYFVAKVLTIMVLIRIISRGVEIFANCLTWLFDKNARSVFCSGYMIEYVICTIIELFILFFFMYIIFTNSVMLALYLGVRIFAIVPEFIPSLNMRCQLLMIIQSVLALIVMVSGVISYVLLSKTKTEKE